MMKSKLLFTLAAVFIFVFSFAGCRANNTQSEKEFIESGTVSKTSSEDVTLYGENDASESSVTESSAPEISYTPKKETETETPHGEESSYETFETNPSTESDKTESDSSSDSGNAVKRTGEGITLPDDIW